MVDMAVEHEAPEVLDSSPYGYGLEISLNEEQAELLGFDKNPPTVGAQVTLQAVAIVTRVTQEVDPNGAEEGEPSPDIDARVCFQITKLGVSGNTSSVNDRAADSLYGGGGFGS